MAMKGRRRDLDDNEGKEEEEYTCLNSPGSSGNNVLDT